jgi:transcription initiation factor TFIID subunit 13
MAFDFTSDIEELMFGFGDEWPPDSQAVKMMDSLVKDYIEELGERALSIAEMRGRLDKECFLFLVRKDKAKFHRVRKLLELNEELKSVRNEIQDASKEGES